MGLRSALDRLPDDRDSRAILRSTLMFFTRHPDEWLGVGRVCGAVGGTPDAVGGILRVLAEDFVLDFDDGQQSYRYHADRLLEIEIDRFSRRADRSEGRLRSNVEKFRHRYGSH